MADGVGEVGLGGDFLRDGRGLPEIVIQVASGFRMEKGEVAERGHVGRGLRATGYCWRPASIDELVGSDRGVARAPARSTKRTAMTIHQPIAGTAT
jgi:hypothetical protein